MSDSVSINNGVAVGKDVKAPGDATPGWRRWWALDAAKADGLEMAQAIEETVKTMKLNQSARMDQATLAARLYGNAPIGLLMGGGRAPLASMTAARDVVKQNVVQSIIDTSTATIGENKPRPYYLTDGGDYRLQRQAKKLNQFNDGIFYELNAYNIGSDAQRDGEIFGDGFIHVGKEFGRLVYRRVLTVELWSDELEGTLTMPRQLHWERPWDRDQLMALWPKKAKIIGNAPRANPQRYGLPPTSTSDMVVLRWSWHLRSGPESTDGVCVASIENTVLSDPKRIRWEEDFYPFARFAWTPVPAAWWSQGLAAQLQSQQIEHNKLNWAIQQAMHRAGTYKVLNEKGSKVVKEHISNEVGAIIDYVGTKPEWVVPPSVPPEHFKRLEDIKNEMYEMAGLSRLTATGEKPAGLDSGEAQRVYRDSVALRMKTQERLNEQGFLDLARISIATARQIALETGKPYEVRSSNQRSLRRISMTADELNPKDWRLQCFPTSSLPKDPAGKLASIQERIQAGFLTFREGKELLDYPDVSAADAMSNAGIELIKQILGDIMDEDEASFRPPEPTMDLQAAKELVLQHIHFGMLHGLDADRMNLLQIWNAQVDALMMAAMPPPALGPGAPMGGGGAPAGPPQGQPMAPPPSNLLPFAA